MRSIRIILEALESPLSPSASPYSSPRSRARSISRPPMPPPPLPIPPIPSSEYHQGGESSRSPTLGSYPAYSGDNSDHDTQFASSSSRIHYRGKEQQHSSPRQRQQRAANYASTSRNHRRAPSNPDSEFDSDSDFQYGSPRSLYNSNSSGTLIVQNAHLEALKQKLQPLKHIEQILIAKLVPPNEDEPTQLPPPGNPYISHANQAGGSQQQSGTLYRHQEIFIRPGPSWKGALSRARVAYGGTESGSSAYRPSSAGNTGLETQDEPQEVLNKLRKEMKQLWHDPLVKEILKRKKIKLEEGSGL